ncbi:Adaptive-response sensory-kinase SasA [subsurface metagenome]
MKSHIIFLIFSISIFNFSYAEDLDLMFSHLTTEKGLSSNTVHCIYQDSKGFMWFGTDDGLNLYDGYEFSIFKYNSKDTNSLSSNSVFGILEDSKDQLWIAAASGVDVYIREQMSFRHIPFVDEYNPSQYESYTRAIIEDHDGNILIANTNGIFIYDTLKKGFVRFLKDIPNYGSLQQEGIRALLIDRNKRIWIGSLGYGLYCFDMNKKQVIASTNVKGAIHISDRIYSIAEDVNGDIWIGSDNGIFIIKSDLSEINTLRNSRGLRSVNIRNIYVENDERIWIGTDGGGLYLYHKSTDSFTSFVSDEFDNYSINNNSVHSIWKDNQGILWLGTYQGGVNFAPIDSKLKFRHIKNEKGNSNSLAYNAVSAFHEDSEGNLWIGTDGGGLDYFNTKTKIFKHYVYNPDNPNSISGNSILTISEDNDRNIWIGGYLLGFNVINRKTGTIKRYKHDPHNSNSLNNDDVRDILICEDNTVWIATNGGGLNKYDPETNRFIHYRQGNNNAIVNDWCLKIYEGIDGRLWIGTYGGLSIFNPKDNTFQNYAKNNDPGSLSNSWVYTFAEDKAGNMWVGTANGLNIFDRETQLFSTILTTEGLSNEVINGILIDNSDNLWLSTNRGISKFNPSDTSFRNYDVNDGLQGNQFIHGSCFKSGTGEMYFGGLNGYNAFYPDSIQDNLFKPDVYLTDFLIFYHGANVNIPGSPLTKSITNSDKIVLTHDQSVITFKYAALNYLNPEKNQYKYILEGSEKEWNDVGTRREATYTNLKPGDYVFKVKASNNDGLWNENATSIKVIILPPWWNTLLFKILIIVLIISSVVGYYFFRINTLKKGQIQLERVVENRTREIKEKSKVLSKQAEELSEINALMEERQQKIEEQTEELMTQKEELEKVNKHLKELNSTKDKFFSIIAHDLKNPFNTILGFSELLVKNYDTLSEEKKRNFSEAIHTSSENVFNLLENLLQWARSQTNSINFEPVTFNLNQIVEENIDLLKEMHQKKKIKVYYHTVENFNVFADRNMINTVIRNLLSNAVKFTNEEGEIWINLNRKKNNILIDIEDSGIGIAEEEKTKLFRVDVHFSREGTGGEMGTGLGLLLCKEYVEKNRGKLWVESEIGKGSIFHFTLPKAS